MALARFARLEGRVLYARGTRDTWVKAVEGISLLSGDWVDTRTGRARLDLAAGGMVCVNRGTVLRVLAARTDGGKAALVDLQNGEVFVDEEGQGIYVETPAGLVSPLGTRFNVRHTRLVTTVTVEQGTVEARGKPKTPHQGKRAVPKRQVRSKPALRSLLALLSRGAVRVPAGTQSSVRRGASPTAPKRVNAAHLAAWANALRRSKRLPPAAQVVFRETYKHDPGNWTGVVSRQVPPGGPQRALKAMPLANDRWFGTRATVRGKGLFPIERSMMVWTRVYLARPYRVHISLVSQTGQEYSHAVEVSSGGRWIVLNVPIPAFLPKVPAGEPIRALSFATGSPADKFDFYVGEIVVYRRRENTAKPKP